MQNRRYDERLRTETEAYFGKFDSYLTHACTFTFRQDVNGNEITAEKAWEYFENYCKYLNRKIYKKGAKRNGKSLLILPILQGEKNNKHLHFHCAIGCVDKKYDFYMLRIKIALAWRKMRWTYNNPKIVAYRDKGWVGYICRESVRFDLNSVDLTRCFFPADSQMK